jgi:VHL beta domain
MLHSKYFLGLAAAVAVFPIGFHKVANAQVGYAGPYGGYYPIPGGAYLAPLPSPNNPNVSDPAPSFRSPNPSSTYSPTKRFISYEQQKICESLLEKKFSSVWAQIYQQFGCKDGSAPKYFSTRWSQPVSVKFINQRNHRINIYWLDYQGIARFYRSLAPREWYIQQTFMTHPWFVSDGNNRGLAVFLPERNVDEAIIR